MPKKVKISLNKDEDNLMSENESLNDSQLKDTPSMEGKCLNPLFIIDYFS